MASAFSFVRAKMCSGCDARSYCIPNIRERPFYMKDSVYNETMLSRLRNRTYRNSRVGAIRNLLQMNGSTGCSALQRIAALRDPDLHVNDKIDGSKIRSYRFQTDNGGFVKVSIGAKQSTCIEVSDMPPSINEHQLALRWQTLRADSLCNLELDNSQSSEIILTQTSPGQHISELEINYPGVPIYLSFFIYSSLSADGFNRLLVRTARKTSFRVPVGFARGNPMPLGLTFSDDGLVNFSLFSKNAERVILCLFEDHSNKPNLEIDLDPYVHKTGDIWHVSLENVQNYISYGFRCEGNLLHNEGGDIVYLDPYARIVRSLSPGNRNFFLSHFLGNLKKVPSFDWSGDVHLCLPAEKLVVYRLNVGNFTRDRSSCLPNDIAGTFSGIIEKIHHFKNLGVSAILLEPIFAFDENQGSYYPHSFFSPANMYGPKGDGELAINSMKEMVKCLHVNGIEVLLEVVFSHTAEGGETTHEGVGILGIDSLSYYVNDGKRSGEASLLNCNKSIVQKMIVDSLRHWVIDFRVDGFSFVNASHFVQGASGHHSSRSSLIELIAIDPILSCTRLIADSWSPLDMLYHEIDFPHWQRWSETNARFCKDARNFFRGEGLVSDLATRLCGSGDIFSDSRGPTFSFNFVTKNSGLSLVDLVSFGGNELLPEFSWNCGAQGPTSNAVILETRLKQIRNFLFLLFVSLGVPVLNMGDECGMSTGGLTSYRDRGSFDWDNLETSFARQIMQFISFLGSLRDRRSDLFQRRDFHKVENIQWHGADHSEPKWEDPSSKFLAVTLKAENDEKTYNSVGGDVFIAFNASDVPSTAVLPEAPKPYKWMRLVDTSCSFPGFFSGSDDPDCSSFSELEYYELKANSCCLFEAKISI